MKSLLLGFAKICKKYYIQQIDLHFYKYKNVVATKILYKKLLRVIFRSNPCIYRIFN